MRMKNCALVMVWTVVCVFSGYSQVTTGTISGTVKDSTGAVLPGVQVVILNADTGLSRTVSSDARGHYAAPQLSLGNYRVSASLEGFQTEVHSGIVLTVGREAVVDIPMTVGAVTQTVEVTGEAPLVQTTESTVGYLVADKSIRELPLNGRDVTQLILLNPGVVSAVTSRADSGTVGFGKRISISGSRGEDNAYLLDGSYINDFSRHIPAGPSGALLGAETVREFQVLTNAFSAQYSRAMGGVFNAVSKSGANDWHGSLYEYLRNSALDARDFFDIQNAPAPSPPPPFRRNQFGGTVSGPVLRDRAFFFAAFEAMRESLTQTSSNVVPTEDAKKGIGVLTGSQTISAKVTPFLQFFPSPTPSGRVFGITAEYIFPATQPTREDFGQGRYDHQLSDSDSVFARFTASNSNRARVADYPGNVSNQNLNSRLVTLAHTRILSARALNAFRFSFNRVAPIANTTGFPTVSGVPTVPGQALPGVSPGNSITGYNTNVTPKIQWLTNRFNEQDDFSLSLGAHALKIGGMLERMQFNADQPNRANGTWTFANFANFLQAIPNNYRGTPPQTGVGSVRAMRQWFYSLYVQDDWQVKPGLTLNLGLRWDDSSVPTEVHGWIANLRHREDLAPTIGDPFWKNKPGNLAPRLGFAWTPLASGKTSVRGGWGLFYVPLDPGVWFRSMARVAPLFPEYDFSIAANAPAVTTFPDALAAIAASTLGTPYGTVYVFQYDNIRTPHTMQYNLNVQQQVDASSVLTVGYVGNRGMNLTALENYNQPTAFFNGRSLEVPSTATRVNPNFECICFYNNTTDSWYNALTVAYQRRFSAGLQTQVSYTWAKTINENDGNNTAANVTTSDFAQLKYTYDGAANRGVSGYGIPKALIINYSYDIPFGRGMDGILGRVVSGWQMSGIFTAQKGQPFTVTSGTPTALANTTVGTRSPNAVAGRSKDDIMSGTTAGCTFVSGIPGPYNAAASAASSVAPGRELGGPNLYFDPCAYSFASAWELGNLGRNTLIGPSLVKWDFSLAKNFAVTEQWNLQFRSELFNIFNHANFSGPAASMFSATGGKQGTAGVISRTLIGNQRQIQFALRLTF